MDKVGKCVFVFMCAGACVRVCMCVYACKYLYRNATIEIINNFRYCVKVKKVSIRIICLT